MRVVQVLRRPSVTAAPMPLANAPTAVLRFVVTTASCRGGGDSATRTSVAPKPPAEEWLPDPLGKYDERLRRHGNIWTYHVRRHDVSGSIPVVKRSRDAFGVEEGWYDDPIETGVERYWDGSSWTNRVQYRDNRIHKNPSLHGLNDVIPSRRNNDLIFVNGTPDRGSQPEDRNIDN